MKRFLFIAQFILLGLLIFSVFATVLQVFGDSNPLTKLDYTDPVYNNVEEYDPSLGRLNSLETLEKYCDSVYLVTINSSEQGEFKKDYTDIVSSVVRKRFFHGYSYYGFSSNYMAMLMSTAILPGLGAVVIPDDILKYPFAACSQQSIVMMELLRAKGFETRKISFQGKITGHFSFEVYFDEAWHFYDTNMEPDINVLISHGRPSIAYLVGHPDILAQAYRRYPPSIIFDVFPTFSYGEINKFPAPKAIVFQKLTKFLSYTIWIFYLFAFLIVRRKYQRRCSMTNMQGREIYFPATEKSSSSSYYPVLTVSES